MGFLKIVALAILAAMAAMAAMAPVAASAQSAGDPAGDWRGTLKAGAIDVRLAMHLGETSTFDSLDQGLRGLPATLTRDGDRVIVTIPNVGRFEGALQDGGSKLAGVLTFGTSSNAIVFDRGTFAAADRPQMPVRPFPYREELVEYDNPYQPGVHLAGTLSIPQGKGPFPAVLLITGSGAQDRDETIFEHKPFLVLSDYLTRRGFAVLRVDDRGVGGSTGAGPDATSNDFATDVRAGVEWLKKRPEVDTKRIGLIGHSEGGIIAPIVAKADPSVAFIILWAGSGVSGRDIIIEQVRAVTASAGAPAEVVAANTDRQRRLVDAILAAPDAKGAQEAAVRILKEAGLDDAQAAAQAGAVTSGWFRNFLRYDPQPTLRALKIPVLALVGGKDVQVVASQNTPALKAALAGNPKAKVVELPGLNHLFQKTETGAVSEYGTITQTIAPEALQLMGDWLAEVAKTGAGPGR